MTRLFLALLSSLRRPWMVALVGIVIMAAAGATLVLAQTTAPRVLKVGETAGGSLDSKTFAQSYAFQAQAADVVTVTATTKTSGLTLALIVAGPDGNILGQASQAAKSTNVSLKDLKIPATGTYLITVLRASGANGTEKGDYTVALTGTSALTSSGTINLAKGLSVALSWQTTDYLSLEVRDPIGGSVNRHNATSQSGGTFAADTNADCASASASNPTDSVQWPAGNVPGGSYEIIVYYLQACANANPAASSTTPLLSAPQTQGTAAATQAVTVPPTPTLVSPPAASGGGDVNFTVTINVNGDTLQPLSGTLKPTQQYVASFIITSPEQITMEPGGPNLSIDLTPFAAKIAAPTTMTGKTSVTGTIDHTNPADAWSITVGQNAAPLTINMTASSGSLDSFLILLGPDGNIIASNDDANENTRDSQIANQTLSAGRYTIVATRFAQQIGGTEGNYTLTANNGARTTTVTSNSLTQTAAAITPTSAQLPPGSIQVKLTWNSRADLRLLIRDPNGVSVFSDNTSPDNSGILDRLGNFKCTSTTTSPTTYAYWPTNLLPPGTYEVGVWLQSRCTDTTILPQYNLSVVVKGQQVIQITDRPDSTSVPGLHSLTTFTVDANGNATAGPRGIVREEFTADITSLKASAPALSYGTPISATIDSTNPFRLFQFTASNGDKVAITLRNTSGDLDPNLFLLNANGVQINANDDVTPSKDINSRIEQTIKADGTYYIVATRYGQDVGGTSGTFELTIARLNQ